VTRPAPEPRFIRAAWPAPPQVLALCTTRVGGVSSPPYNSFNLATHVHDKAQDVAVNREQLAQTLALDVPVPWLNQVHGTSVVRSGAGAEGADADAVWTDSPGQPCAVLTADCLPVLFCSHEGDRVGAAHAGWRGLAGGVLEATIEAMDVPGEQLMAWLGPAIGPSAFEVGPEVREAFVTNLEGAARRAVEACFVASVPRPGHYHADLYALARLRLARCGVRHVYGGGECTYTDADSFFSYRRERDTGRMASLILVIPPS